MLEQQSLFEVQEAFSEELVDLLSYEQLLIIWKLDNKPIDSFIGWELKLFSKNASKIASWASENNLISGTNPEWTNIPAAFKLWEKCMHLLLKRK